ncbi:hypothetical protein HYD45_02315 [Mycoplasmopsis bovis]|nr:hypothetical protein [Mycoplasmopsis bovis]QQH78453.1 hypothetical protein HYD45_02315 [Mycoplasmopsis bovis]
MYTVDMVISIKTIHDDPLTISKHFQTFIVLNKEQARTKLDEFLKRKRAKRF